MFRNPFFTLKESGLLQYNISSTPAEQPIHQLPHLIGVILP